MSESCLDDALTTRITKLANFVAQKGDAMEQMVRTKNGADPDWGIGITPRELLVGTSTPWRSEQCFNLLL